MCILQEIFLEPEPIVLFEQLAYLIPPHFFEIIVTNFLFTNTKLTKKMCLYEKLYHFLSNLFCLIWRVCNYVLTKLLFYIPILVEVTYFFIIVLFE